MADNPYQNDNPYQSPVASIGDKNSLASTGEVSRGTIELLSATRPWTLFLAILGFIGCGLMVLGALGMFFLSQKVGGISYMLGLASAYVIIAAIWVMPFVRLRQYSSAIKALSQSPTHTALEYAIDRQRSFWKIVGIMTIIFVALYIIAIVVSVAGASRFSEY